MSDLLPLFPLPNVVLFPTVFLPLHVFEPRYRELVTDALASDRLIGMVLLRPGWERDYEGRPPVYPVGCSGVITHVERLADGRFNIVLRGVERFRIVREDQARPYRRAAIEPQPERPPTENDRAVLRGQRTRLEALVASALRQSETGTGASEPPRISTALSDEDLVNALGQYLDLDPIEKQALLEHDCLRSRAESLIELLEMKILTARMPAPRNLAH